MQANTTSTTDAAAGMNIERNHVYKMDCLDGLRLMARGGVQVDCIITDPPYLIEYESNHRKDKTHKFCKPILNDNNPQLIIDLMPLLYDVLKDNAPMYMFCGSDKVDFFKQQVERYFTVKNIIVWDKGNHTAGDLEAQYGKRYEFSFTPTKDAPRLWTVCRDMTIFGDTPVYRAAGKYIKTKSRPTYSRALYGNTPASAI